MNEEVKEELTKQFVVTYKEGYVSGIDCMQKAITQAKEMMLERLDPEQNWLLINTLSNLIKLAEGLKEDAEDYPK